MNLVFEVPSHRLKVLLLSPRNSRQHIYLHTYILPPALSARHQRAVVVEATRVVFSQFSPTTQGSDRLSQ